MAWDVWARWIRDVADREVPPYLGRFGAMPLPLEQCEWIPFEERFAVWKKMLFTAICVTVPVAWGIFVNWIFDRLRNRNHTRTADEPVFHDYQI